MKRHIRKNNDTSFCGRKFTIWRHGRETYGKYKGPIANAPLQTGTYEESTCLSCTQSFILMAKTLNTEGTLQAFIAASTT